MIYLDHNAATRMPEEVIRSISEAYAAGYANPASQHAAGREARRTLDRIRDEIRQRLGAREEGHLSDRVIFTSGGTEANNLALRGLCGSPPGQIVVSAIEHPCIEATAAQLQREGFQVDRIRCDLQGRVDLVAMEEALSDQTRLVSLMLANHETGVIQPVPQVAEACRRLGVPLHSDAAQAVGKLPVDFTGLGISAMTVSAHKFHGPVGIGTLVVRHGLSLAPLLLGGGQQLGIRPGTESIALPAGMRQALRWSESHLCGAEDRIGSLRDRFEQILLEELPDLVIHGRDTLRLPNTSCVAFLGVDRQAMLMALDQAGVACSTGSACASGSSEPSPVLLGMGCAVGVVNSSLRFSLGPENDQQQAESAADRVVQTARRLRG